MELLIYLKWQGIKYFIDAISGLGYQIHCEESVGQQINSFWLVQLVRASISQISQGKRMVAMEHYSPLQR